MSTIYLIILKIQLDNVSFGADADDDYTYEFHLKSKYKLREGGFNHRKFVTNLIALHKRG